MPERHDSFVYEIYHGGEMHFGLGGGVVSLTTLQFLYLPKKASLVKLSSLQATIIYYFQSKTNVPFLTYSALAIPFLICS